MPLVPSYIQKLENYVPGKLIEEFQRFNIQTGPSITNFLSTVWESEKQAETITEYLLRNGIIVRHLKAFDHCEYFVSVYSTSWIST